MNSSYPKWCANWSGIPQPDVYSLHCRYFQLLGTLTVQCYSLFPSQAVRWLVRTPLSNPLPIHLSTIVLQWQRSLFQASLESKAPFSLKNFQSNFSHNFLVGRTLPATQDKPPEGSVLLMLGPWQAGPYALRYSKWKYFKLVQTEAAVHNCSSQVPFLL